MMPLSLALALHGRRRLVSLEAYCNGVDNGIARIVSLPARCDLELRPHLISLGMVFAYQEANHNGIPTSGVTGEVFRNCPVKRNAIPKYNDDLPQARAFTPPPIDICLNRAGNELGASQLQFTTRCFQQKTLVSLARPPYWEYRVLSANAEAFYQRRLVL